MDFGDLNYSLAADPTHAVARDYGVLIEEEGVALRGLFIINPEGELQYAVVNHNNIGRQAQKKHYEYFKHFKLADFAQLTGNQVKKHFIKLSGRVE